MVEGRSLEIKPYDTSALAEIEKALFQANLGLTPQNDGKLIRLSFPPLTEERRKELAKGVKKLSEDARVSICSRATARSTRCFSAAIRIGPHELGRPKAASATNPAAIPTV